MGEAKSDQAKNEALKKIPKVDALMLILQGRGLDARISRDLAVGLCREAVNEIREAILNRGESAPSETETADRIQRKIEGMDRYRLRPVVNATGIILHTNLGRAPLCEEALRHVAEVSRGYCNLEFDLSEAKRGSRYDHVRELVCGLTATEDAIVVNNNAAAVLLALNTLAEGRQVVVSRGELIEIGGEFRLPEVMEKGNAVLKEVGTTNRTRLADYEKAINENTGLLLKAHTSNYRITGYTGEVGLAELVGLGKKYGIPVMDDLGSGCLVGLDRFGLQREPTVQETVSTGVDVVTFSGDKLLGGPQAGIIVGKTVLIQRIRKNPLNRALRIDKLTIAALEATLKIYRRDPSQAVQAIRALKALTEPAAEVEKRAKKMLRKIRRAKLDALQCTLKKGFSMAGGGSLPGQEIPTFLVSIHSTRISPNKMEALLRGLEVPVVAGSTAMSYSWISGPSMKQNFRTS